MLVYVSGKYSPPENALLSERNEIVKANIEIAGRVAGELWDKGHAVICPHSNTSEFLVPTKNTEWKDYIRGDKMIIALCGALVMLPDWKSSKGAVEEYEYALSLGIPIWFYPELPELHPTEVLSPVQCQAFAETLGKMNRTHHDKNADYSSSNVLGPGELGGLIRLWDKAVRLANLNGISISLEDVHFDGTPDEMKPIIWTLLVSVIKLMNTLGFRFKITKIMVGKTKNAKNESIDDTLIDLSVYAIIQRLLMAGKWGR